MITIQTSKPRAQITVVKPSNMQQVKIIHRMVERVIKNGSAFEVLLQYHIYIVQGLLLIGSCSRLLSWNVKRTIQSSSSCLTIEYVMQCIKRIAVTDDGHIYSLKNTSTTDGVSTLLCKGIPNHNGEQSLFRCLKVDHGGFLQMFLLMTR